tara:strand:- start:40 stop:366 length:327 start_codon:yes stop_codon:yes gene_type:complete
MNNTEKKLDALIDALGFDVEEIRTRNNEAYNHDLKVYGGMLGMMPANGRNYITTEFKFTKRGVKTTKGIRDYLRECFDGNNEPLHYCDDCAATRTLNPDDVKIGDINE